MQSFHGRTAGRYLRSLVVARGDRAAAQAFAAGQGWADAREIRSAIGGLESSGANGTRNLVEIDFVEMAMPLTLLGKMTATRRGSFTHSTLAQTGRATGAWTGQSKAAPVSLPTMSRLAPLPAFKVTAAVIASLESAMDGAEEVLARDLAAAVALAADEALVDGVDTDGTTRPASIVYNADTVASGGDVADDCAAAIAEFTGSLMAAAWLCHPSVAAAAGLQVKDPGLGALGGRLCGLPCLVSEGFSLDSNGAGDLVLVDQSALQLAGLDRAMLSTSQEAAIEMADNPAAATDTPTAMANTLVSMFVADAVAVLATMPLSWRLVRTGSVVAVTGCSYTGAIA